MQYVINITNINTNDIIIDIIIILCVCVILFYYFVMSIIKYNINAILLTSNDYSNAVILTQWLNTLMTWYNIM